MNQQKREQFLSKNNLMTHEEDNDPEEDHQRQIEVVRSFCKRSKAPFNDELVEQQYATYDSRLLKTAMIQKIEKYKK